jgi:hypothetical protein
MPLKRHPVLERFGGQLGPVVAADVGGRAAPSLDDLLECRDRVVGADPAGRWGGQGFAGVLVGDREDLERPAVGGAV